MTLEIVICSKLIRELLFDAAVKKILLSAALHLYNTRPVARPLDWGSSEGGFKKVDEEEGGRGSRYILYNGDLRICPICLYLSRSQTFLPPSESLVPRLCLNRIGLGLGARIPPTGSRCTWWEERAWG